MDQKNVRDDDHVRCDDRPLDNTECRRVRRIRPLGVGGVGVSLFWGAMNIGMGMESWRKFPAFMFKSKKHEKKFYKIYNQYRKYHYASSIKIRKPEKKIKPLRSSTFE